MEQRLTRSAAILLVLACAGAIAVGCSLDRAGFASGTDAGALPDVGPGCLPGSCDDGNACTDDRCDPGGCVFANNDDLCDDDVLCNGADSCSGGSCSGHSGVDPCPGASTCDVGTDACIGCTTAADCPAAMTGAFGACEFAGDPCSLAGTRSRSITTYACSAAAVCEPTITMESEACARETDGIECAPTSTGTYGACSYADTCSESGSRTRTNVVSTCTGGTCGTESVIEIDMAGCVRDTDTMACGAPTFGPWSLCGGFVGICGETGSQTRTSSTPTCTAGTCAPIAGTDSRACTRDTDGAECAMTTCTAFGACMPSSAMNDCSTAGTQSQTCTSHTCGGGACVDLPMSGDQNCMYDPSGDPCTTVLCSACRTGSGSACPSGSTGTQACTTSRRTCVGGVSGATCTGSLIDTMVASVPCTCL